MTAEQSTVQFGRTSIPYVIERGKRLKTVAIAVDPERGTRVRAPQHTPVAKLDDIVLRKARWIIDRRRRYEDLPPRPTPREFVSGETFLYAGKQYRLKLVQRGKEGVRLVGARIELTRGMDARNALVAWYRQRAQECRRQPACWTMSSRTNWCTCCTLTTRATSGPLSGARCRIMRCAANGCGFSDERWFGNDCAERRGMHASMTSGGIYGSSGLSGVHASSDAGACNR
jgi:Protein of unknown function DUF45